MSSGTSTGVSPDSEEFDCDDSEDDEDSLFSSYGLLVVVVALVVVLRVVVETGKRVLVGFIELVVVDSMIGLKSSGDG